MKKILLGLLLLLPLAVEAQPTPGTIDLGVVGNTPMYTGPHRIGPGNGSNVIFVVIATTNLLVYTNNVDYITTYSNTFITFLTDVYFSGKSTFNQIVLTNALECQTNKWNGATNILDLNVYSQSYSSLTPVNVSGFNLPTNAPESQVLQQITDISSTNVTATWPASVVAVVNGTIGATSATITNGTTGYFWWHYTPANNGGRTNLVFLQL